MFCMRFPMFSKTYLPLIQILSGSFLYALGLNVFVIPLGLFSGGAVGMAQLLCIPIANLFSTGPEKMISIVYFLLNIPLLWFAWHNIGKSFLLKTLIGILSVSFFMRIISICSTPIDDTLVSVLIGGLISGFGIGIVLTAGGSAGGVDILGVLAVKRFHAKSVGTISMVINGIIYALLLIYFDFTTFVYSLLYLAFFTIALDRAHYQNINLRLMVFTKKAGLDRTIIDKTGRGVTEWTGIGAFTNEQTHILITCINKYEYNTFLDLIHTIDPQAFIISDENVRINGNFEKRL